MSAIEDDREQTRPMAGSSVQYVVDQLHEALYRGDYSPGEHLRQDRIADDLQVSRMPVREALSMLVSEGIVEYHRNQGYFVAKVAPGDMAQVYLMRRLLEDELLASLDWPDDDEIQGLYALNAEMSVAVEAGRIDLVVPLNREFHLRVFSYSRLNILYREVERLWRFAEPYRALYLYNSAVPSKILSEHEALLTALADRDAAAAVAVMSQHRQGAANQVAKLSLMYRGRPATAGPRS